MSPRRWTRAGSVVLVVVAVTAVGIAVSSSGADHSTAAASSRPTTAKVERGSLSTTVSQSGTLTYRAGPDGAPFTVINRAVGIYTELPDSGAAIACGAVLYRVDDHPVMLLCGTTPAYRDLHVGEVGPDVRQLNDNLHQLGIDAGLDRASSTFTARTALALVALQQRVGQAASGSLGLADAVFLPSSVRIAQVPGQLGGTAQPGTPVLTSTSDTLEVHLELDPSQQSAVQVGDAAQITLPNNASTTGKVDRLGRIAQTPTGANAAPAPATVGAYLSFDHPEAAGALDQAPVRVEITTKGVDDALSVPVTAIVGRIGGGYAVQVVGRDGGRTQVAVRLGLFDTAGGRVQVDGHLHAGDDVTVPSP